jgi:hypothetical protein
MDFSKVVAPLKSFQGLNPFKIRPLSGEPEKIICVWQFELSTRVEKRERKEEEEEEVLLLQSNNLRWNHPRLQAKEIR